MDELRPPETSTLCALRFIRQHWILILLLSGLVLVPCFWHRRIEAGDLGSHTYNAWLSVLVSKGEAPGLYVAPQWNNVAVDLALSWLGPHLGFITAERIVVAACVLCFFWGAFSFIAASTRAAPWFLVPAILIVTYGYTFYSGFLNYYLSVGLVFWAAAVLWRGTGIDWALGAFLAFLTFLAHPMGFAILLAAVAYIRLVDLAPGWYRWLVLAAALLVVVGVHWYLLRFRAQGWLGVHGLLLTGADQLLLFGHRYKLLAEAVLALGSLSFVIAASRDWKQFPLPQRVWTPLTLWALLLVAATMMPGVIWLPQYAGAVSSIATRLTSITAIVGLCVLSSVRPRKWILAGLVVCAAVFFTFQYQDTATLNRMEQQIEELVGRLPYGWRVSYTVYLGEDNRINFRHMVDRACIERCFAYSNYEPRTGQFRVRVAPAGSSIVSNAGLEMELGKYVVRPSDLPMAQIYQPDESDLTKLAIRRLAAGEENGSKGHQPPAKEVEARLHQHRN